MTGNSMLVFRPFVKKIEILTALVGRLSLSIGLENGPERGLPYNKKTEEEVVIKHIIV